MKYLPFEVNTLLKVRHCHGDRLQWNGTAVFSEQNATGVCSVVEGNVCEVSEKLRAFEMSETRRVWETGEFDECVN